MPTLTNAKHEAFCRAIAKGKSNTDAYIAAGYEYSSRAAAGRYAYRLRKREDIAERIEELTGKTKGRIARRSGRERHQDRETDALPRGTLPDGKEPRALGPHR